MNDIEPDTRSLWRSAAVRGMMLFGLWIILTGAQRSDLGAGIFAATLATWVSVLLLPPGTARPALLPMLTFILHFFRQSVVASFDVARRAFDPRLPLKPGYVEFSCPISVGPARSAFCALSSLLPGTVPVKSEANGNILIHCLDTRQPVVEQLSEDAGLYREAIGVSHSDG